MARPSKDRRLNDAKLASSIQGVLRIINEQLETTKDPKKKAAHLAHQQHLVSLYNALTNPAATVRPKQTGSRLLLFVCEGCGYKIRTTRQWADLAIPRCPMAKGTRLGTRIDAEPVCEKSGEEMTHEDMTYNAEVNEVIIEEAKKRDKTREEAFKELRDFFGEEAASWPTGEK